MGKRGPNAKAAAALERKAGQKAQQALSKAKADEDAAWKDDGTKKLRQKQGRAADKQRKADEGASRKAEMRAAVAEEEAEMAKLSKKKNSPKKATAADIEARRLRREYQLAQLAKTKKGKKGIKTAPDLLAQANPNKATAEGDVDASGIDSVLAALDEGGADKRDMHVEKRRKAAFNAFLEDNMDRIKSEKPGLKLSQYRQFLFKEFQKSPDNPMNQQPA